MGNRIRTLLLLSGGLLLAVLALVLAGCSDSDDSTTTDGGGGDDAATVTTAPAEAAAAAVPASDRGEVSATATTQATAEDAAAGSAADQDQSGGDESSEGPAAVPVALQPADIGRSLVFTGDMAVVVEDVTAAGRRAQVTVEQLGGILFGQESSSDPRPTSVLTFKVRPEGFRTALERFEDLGRVTRQTVTTDDVTERVVDLGSRIATAETSVGRLRDLLAGATDLQAVASLETELLNRETQLEQLRGQLRTLEGQVSLATIVLVLNERQPAALTPAVEVVETAYAGHDGGAGCPAADDVDAAEGDPVTVCFTVSNTGNTPIGGIDVSDEALGIDSDDLISVAGDPDDVLDPGDRMVLAHEGEARPGVVAAPTATVTAFRPNGTVLPTDTTTVVEPVRLDVAADTSLPGFGDSLSAGGRAVQWLVGVVLLAAGVLLPFLWVPVLVAAGWALYRRRHRSTDGGAPSPGSASAG